MLYRNFETQEELDEQYKVADTVDSYEDYAQWYAETSRDTRDELESYLDVSFGPTVAEHLDIFPATQPDAPVVLFIHGGYWHSLSSKEFSFVARGLVASGMTTVVLNYELAPKVTIDEIVRQTRAAVVWIDDNISSYNGDSEQIHVAGHSAGGHLTGMVLATDWEQEYERRSDIVNGATAISGLFDLEPFPYTWLQPKLQLTWGQVRRNSPIRHIPADGPPLIVTYGEEEPSEMRRQSDAFLEAWRDAGHDGKYVAQPGDDHFSAIDGFLDPDSPLLSAIGEQIESS